MKPKTKKPKKEIPPPTEPHTKPLPFLIIFGITTIIILLLLTTPKGVTRPNQHTTPIDTTPPKQTDNTPGIPSFIITFTNNIYWILPLIIVLKIIPILVFRRIRV